MSVESPVTTQPGTLTTLERLSAYAGLLATVIGLGSVILATIISPTFQWTVHPLSALGDPDRYAATARTALVFNWGLIAGGLIGFGMGYRLWQTVRNGIEVLGILLLGLTAVSMALVGVFPTPHEYHGIVSMLLYLSISMAFLVFGTGVAVRGIHRYGLGTMWLGVMNTMTWLNWLAGGDLGRDGLAIPEFIGALVLAIWTVWTARRLLRHPPG